jgi:hypothetical protein
MVALTATESVSDDACVLDLDPEQLRPAEHTAVEVTVPAACISEAEDRFTFTVSADTSPPQVFDVTATQASDVAAEPKWGALLAFPIGLGASLALAVIVTFMMWSLNWQQGPTTRLKHLDAAWSFNDSWVSNVTVLGGLLTGIFGSTEVVTALLGEDAEGSAALAIVGSAVAAALVAAGPIVLLILKQDDYFTPLGLLFASAFTLAGAAGEIWVVYSSGRALDLGGWGNWIIVLAVLGYVLLLFYALTSLPATMRAGVIAPQAAVGADSMQAALVIATALGGGARASASTKRLALSCSRLKGSRRSRRQLFVPIQPTGSAPRSPTQVRAGGRTRPPAETAI